jgi:hypothetical protein
MQTRILTALLCGCALAGFALADTVVVNDEVTVRESSIERPQRGLTMDEVEKKFGAPLTRHPAAGGGTPHHPPITRWDYKGFSVFFEGDHVIHSVVVSDDPATKPAAVAASSPSSP